MPAFAGILFLEDGGLICIEPAEDSQGILLLLGGFLLSLCLRLLLGLSHGISPVTG